MLSLSLIQLQSPKDRKIFDTSHYPESKCSLEAESIKSDNLRSLLVSEVTIELPLQVYPNFIVESDQSQRDLILNCCFGRSLEPGDQSDHISGEKKYLEVLFAVFVLEFVFWSLSKYLILSFYVCLYICI